MCMHSIFHLDLFHMCVCMRACMLGCTTVPVAPYYMLSSVGMWSPLDDVILQWPTPLQGCGNRLDPTYYPRGGDVVSSIHGHFSLTCFSLFLVAFHGVRVSARCEKMQLLVKIWPGCDLALMSLYPGILIAKYLLEKLGNRKWCSTCCTLHNLLMLCQEHGKGIFF